MKRFNLFWANVLAMALVAGFAGAVLADDAGGGKTDEKPLKGKVVSVASDGLSFIITSGRKDPKQTTVTCDANTTVTIDGNASKVTDLKEGLFVEVSPATGTAKTVTAKTPKHPKTPPGAAPGAAAPAAGGN